MFNKSAIFFAVCKFLFAITTLLWTLFAKPDAKHGPPTAEIFVSVIPLDFNNLLSLVHEESRQLSKATNLSPYDSLISKYDMDYDSSKIDKIFEIIKSEIIPNAGNATM